MRIGTAFPALRSLPRDLQPAQVREAHVQDDRIHVVRLGKVQAIAAGPGEVRPEPREAGQLIFQLGELHLEPAIVRARVLGEDVQDQPASVDHLDREEPLEGLLLTRRQLVVSNEQVESRLRLRGHQLLRLALADVPVLVEVAAVLPFRSDDRGSGRLGERDELRERVLGVPAGVVASVDGDEEHLLGDRRDLDRGGAGHGNRTPDPLSSASEAAHTAPTSGGMDREPAETRLHDRWHAAVATATGRNDGGMR
jgi:hypothetical protein